MGRGGWLQQIYKVPRRTIVAFFQDGRSSDAAALAYYAVFSLPPLLFIAVSVAALVFDRAAIVSTIYLEVNATLGRTAAQTVVETLASAQRSGVRGGIETLLSVLVLAYSATGAFAQLQASLNRIWGVRPDPRVGEIRGFLLKRAASFGMVLSLGFLLMVSLLLSAALTALAQFTQRFLPSNISSAFLEGVHEIVSLLIFAILFASIFKVLPDTHLKWKYVALGGLLTALLFTVGRALLGIYLANSDVTTAYGAEASLVVLLIWIYYSSITILLGAGLTRSLALEDQQESDPESEALPETLQSDSAHVKQSTK